MLENNSINIRDIEDIKRYTRANRDDEGKDKPA